jgi:hypothetical protein
MNATSLVKGTEMFPSFYTAYDILDRQALDTYMQERGFTYVGEGRARRTYLSKNKRYVLKFHIAPNLIHNQREAATWRNFFSKPNSNNHDCLYAPCRLIDGKILMMRAMVEVYGGTGGCTEARSAGLGGCSVYDSEAARNNLPDPVRKWSADICQFGKMSNGKYAIYDYG